MNLTSTEAAERLRKDYGIRVGSKIYTTVLHVSRSGMSRTIQTTISHKGQVFDISHLVAAATGMRFDRDRGGVVPGTPPGPDLRPGRRVRASPVRRAVRVRRGQSLDRLRHREQRDRDPAPGRSGRHDHGDGSDRQGHEQ